MIIVQLAGGLGNQMFQYALARRLMSMGRNVKIDDRAGFEQDLQRNPALSVFGISYERPQEKELRRMLDSDPALWYKVRRKLCGRKKKSYFEETKRFLPQVLEWDDIYLEGYWQSEKYFEPIHEQIRELYNTDKIFEHTGNVDAVLRREIGQGDSVSVHIRRGDYLTPENEKLYGNICTPQYYWAAMQEMKRRHPNCHFYLFTNDVEWIRSWDACGYGKESTIVDTGSGESADYRQFALMAECRHHILANSSFSWWASYLHPHEDKIVLAPAGWLNGWDCTDLYRSDMIVI